MPILNLKTQKEKKFESKNNKVSKFIILLREN